MLTRALLLEVQQELMVLEQPSRAPAVQSDAASMSIHALQTVTYSLGGR